MRAVGRLADLVLVVEAALDVGDAAVRRPARALLGQDRHLVGDLALMYTQKA